MKERSVSAVVIKSIAFVFTLSILGLATMGVRAAISNDLPIVAALLVVVALWLAVSAIVTARRALHEQDPEAYELRRYD
jgi:hypothetical protein